MRTLACLLLAAALHAQAPQFEAATMKLVPAGEPNRARTVDGAILHYPGVSLLFLLREAYRVPTRDQVAGPDWMRVQLYQIDAKLPSAESRDQIPEMLQALLAERLKLSVHHESRPLNTNFLLAGKKAPKMRRAAAADDQLDLKLDVPLVHLSGKGTVAQLIDQLNHGLGGGDPWVDQTGLTGAFEIKLDFALASGARTAPGDASAAPSAAQAIEQQLGLRVETRKAPADFVVVDHVERTPIQN
jgi:uncharacterized protein (TIGR03435 family)